MKKVVLSLVVIFITSFQLLCAQNYDVVYSLTMNPNNVIKMMSRETGVPKAMLSFLKDDIRNAKLIVALRITKDKSDMKFLKDQSKFDINFMGTKIDGTSMFENGGINNYCDYANDIYYTKINLKGQNYIIRIKPDPEPQYQSVNLYKKVLGHECKKMVDRKDNTVIWYATDIPFTNKMFPDVPGLVLEIAEESEGMTLTATSVKATDKDAELPKNAKEVTKKEMKKIIDDMK